jgi:NTP pyrophosphatase (non-canonical NTP hydrolase)
MQQSFQDVVQFQTYCGKLDKPASQTDLLNQASLIVEEAEELRWAISGCEGDEQILKETCDSLVVLFGMVAMLQRSGFDVSGAMRVVCENNMSKFCTSQTDGAYTLSAYEATALEPFTLKQVDYNKWGVFNAAEKLQKPIGYSKCSVKAFIPQGGIDD